MKVLGIFAHPDDETILVGGTLAMLAARGAELHLLTATRGEGGEMGEPPLTDRGGLGELREQELRCAFDALGGVKVDFLDFEDPVIEIGQEGLAFDADPETLSQELEAYLLRLKPQVVFTHGSNGEYGHPAHILLHQAVFRAASKVRVCMYGVSASFNEHPRPRLSNQDDPADVVLDITPWLDRKLEAANCHRTQHALFVRRSSREAGREVEILEVLMAVESLHRFLPRDRGQTTDAFGEFLQACCPHDVLYLALPGD